MNKPIAHRFMLFHTECTIQAYFINSKYLARPEAGLLFYSFLQA